MKNMAPRETKVTPKIQRVVKTNTTKKLPTALSSTSALKRPMSARKTTKQVALKATNTVAATPQRKALATKAVTPKLKDNKTSPNSNASKSAKKSWQRRPKPAHSGVPLPEKMQRLLQQQLQDSDCSL